jgi:peptide/nickel transport system ATP-binding protein
VAGEVPSPINPPSGCTFHPRCPFANERCKVEQPRALPIEGGTVACHAIEEGRLAVEERSYAAAGNQRA